MERVKYQNLDLKAIFGLLPDGVALWPGHREMLITSSFNSWPEHIDSRRRLLMKVPVKLVDITNSVRLGWWRKKNDVFFDMSKVFQQATYQVLVIMTTPLPSRSMMHCLELMARFAPSKISAGITELRVTQEWRAKRQFVKSVWNAKVRYSTWCNDCMYLRAPARPTVKDAPFSSIRRGASRKPPGVIVNSPHGSWRPCPELSLELEASFDFKIRVDPECSIF